MRYRSIVGFLLFLHAALLAWGAHIHSPTWNEPGHLASGVSIWQLGRFDVYRVNPPLVRMVAAAPMLFAGVKTDWRGLSDWPGARPESTIGENFVAVNGERSFLLFTLARWACLPFSLLGGYICWRWAKELYGPAAGLLALTLWCFCPNVIGHGQLITADVPAAALAATAGYTFWRWLRRPTWYATVLCGLALGIAELVKTTLLVFYPLWPLLWLIFRLPERRDLGRRHWLRELGMVVVGLVLGVWIVNLGYAFEGSGTRLGDFRFVSAALGAQDALPKAPPGGGNRFAGRWLGAVPLPLPRDYVLGIDLQKRDFEDYREPSYLHGTFSSKGWWYYYLYALLLKVPLGTWLLMGLAATVARGSTGNVRWRDEFLVLTPPLVILTFVSSQSGFSQHMRYVLPAFPFVFVWISRVAAVLERRRWLPAGVLLFALAWSVSSSLWTYPHSLSYFNELAGGPRGGPVHLLHSNVDWGQDLLILKQWLDAHSEAQPLKLAYYGDFDPCYAGIQFTAPEELLGEGPSGSRAGVPPGWYAISVNLVRGAPCGVFAENSSRKCLSPNALAVFQQFQPVAMAGYSIYLYHITGDEANRLRR